MDATKASAAAVPSAALAGAVDLLRELIRAACVNDGSDTSGQEIRAVQVLQRFLADVPAGSLPIEMQVFEAMPGRASLIARVRGTDEAAPALGLLGHLDVVPVDPNGWTRDPHAAELIDGVVWGRGAVDMLYLTAVFACVLREAAIAGETPRGDLVLLAVADEEAGGERGLKWLLRHHGDALRVTEVLSESGGMRMGSHVAIGVGEKGSAGRKLVVAGKPGHASIPFGADNASLRLGQVLSRLAEAAPAVQLGPLWNAFIDARVDDPLLAERLRDPVRLDAALAELGGIAGYAHAVSRVTISPTVVRAGSAHNVIPGEGRVNLDIRTLPGVDDAEVDELLRALLGPLAEQVRIKHLLGWPASSSPTDTELFASVVRAVTAVSGAPVVPIIAAGGSDLRHFRALGIPCYGFGLLSAELSYEEYRRRIHGNDERIDVESIALSLEALREVVRERVGGA